MLNRTQAPPIQPITNLDIAQAQTIRLDNGVPLHLIKAGSQPVVSIELIFNAGVWAEPVQGVSYLGIKMLQEGTRQRTATEIMEHVALYGAFLETHHGADRSSIELFTLTKHVGHIIPILSELISEAIYPQAELANLQQRTVQGLKVNELKTNYLASKHFKALLFGAHHPYGHSLTEEAITAVTREQLIDFYTERIVNAPFEIIMAGDCTDGNIKVINQILGSINVRNVTQSISEFKPVDRKQRTEVVRREDSLQSSVRLGRMLFTRHHHDYLKLRVLNEVFGGYFGSRLMKNIREDKGYTYGIYAQLVALNHAGYMVIGADVNKNNTEDTIREIKKEMEILRNEPIPAEELETVRNYMLGSFANSINTPFALADKFKAIHFDGLGYEYYDRLIATIQQVTADELMEIAQLYYKPDEMLEVVAGDRI